MAQEGLTGFRKYKSPIVSQINARKKYLPSIYSLRREKKYQDRSHTLDLKRQELAKDAAHEARKRNKLAANLGYAGLGLQAGFGLANQFDNFSFDSTKDVVGDVASEIPGLGEAAFLGSPTDSLSDFWNTSALKTLGGLGGDSAGGGFLEDLTGELFDFTDWNLF